MTDFLTPAGVAARLQISERQVRRLLSIPPDRGGIPCIRTGTRQRRVRIDLLAEWEARQSYAPAREEASKWQSGETPRPAGGASKSNAGENPYTAASRQVHRRVMPGCSKAGSASNVVKLESR
jgi:excisionase family DNA binding protein